MPKYSVCACGYGVYSGWKNMWNKPAFLHNVHTGIISRIITRVFSHNLNTADTQPIHCHLRPLLSVKGCLYTLSTGPITTTNYI